MKNLLLTLLDWLIAKIVVTSVCAAMFYFGILLTFGVKLNFFGLAILVFALGSVIQSSITHE